VDARDRLRRYLEQRRELGESEFVLDGLPVEDVLRVVGVRKGAAARTPRQQAQPVPPPPSGNLAREGALPEVPVAPPPRPERRFAEDVSTDWRETLRSAGAGHPGPVSAGDDVGAGIALPPWLDALGIPAGLEAGRVRVADVAPHIASLSSLAEVADHVAVCTACALHKTAKHAVPGEGNAQAEFLCVGEAPGANEDEQGRPFVGDAGQLLTKILGAIQLSRDDVYICNVLKHRPPGNRDPLPDEVLACQPFLLRQIEMVQPRVILALGRFAAQTLLQTTTGIGALRGKLHRFHGVPLIVTYHPAALLRNESWKRPTWEDVKLARRVLDAARAAHGGTE
jgi:DNA polymerase